MANPDGRKYPDKGRSRSNLEYYQCRNCCREDGKAGFFFSRRAPRDPFDNPVTCPNCGAKYGDFVRDENGEIARFPSGHKIPLIYRAETHREIAEWRRYKARQDRELPFKAPVGQHVRVSMRFIDTYSMKLTHLDLRILLILLRFQDHSGKGMDGWTPPLSQKTIGTYCMPPKRGTPIRRETINESLHRMRELRVAVWSPAAQDFFDKPLVEWIDSHPKRFKVNMP